MDPSFGGSAQNIPLLLPIFALVAWTLFITLWMIVVRTVQAVRNARRDEPTSELLSPQAEKEFFPPRVRWKGDNANHLLEQPNLFYALCLGGILAGIIDKTYLTYAWAYVTLRIVHSLWQCLINTLPIRFLLYLVSTAVLILMVAHFGRVLFNQI